MLRANETVVRMGKGHAQASNKVGHLEASRRILFGVPCMMHVTTLFAVEPLVGITDRRREIVSNL